MRVRQRQSLSEIFDQQCSVALDSARTGGIAGHFDGGWKILARAHGDLSRIAPSRRQTRRRTGPIRGIGKAIHSPSVPPQEVNRTQVQRIGVSRTSATSTPIAVGPTAEMDKRTWVGQGSAM